MRMKCTNELRYLVREISFGNELSKIERALQQKWIETSSGKHTWKDVPTESQVV